MLTSDPIVPGASALADLKAFLRIDAGGDDPVLVDLLAAAIALGESWTGSAFLSRGYSEVRAVDTSWSRLAAAPATAVLAVVGAYDGPLPAGAYEVDIDADGRGRIRSDTARLVRVGYRAGLAPDWDALPEALRLGVLRYAAHLFAFRDRAEDPGVPSAVFALWRAFKPLVLA